MALLLREITTPLRYHGKDDTIFFDYYAMYDLWRRVGNSPNNQSLLQGPPYPTQARTKIIDQVFEQVSKQFADYMLKTIAKNLKQVLDTNPNNIANDIKKAVNNLQHSNKVNDLVGVYSAINDFFEIQRSVPFLFKFSPLLSNSKIINQRSISLSNPARYLNKVSPLISSLIKSNLQYFGDYDKTRQEMEKDKKALQATRIPFSKEEENKLIHIGFEIIAPGKSYLPLQNTYERLYIDKLEDNTFILFNAAHTKIHEFPEIDGAVGYVIKNYSKQLPRIKAIQASPTQFKHPPRTIDINPADLSGKDFGDQVSNDTFTKQLGSNFEQVLSKYGYKWDENTKSYKNSSDDEIKIFNDNSAKLYKNNGGLEQFKNLGLLLRGLAHGNLPVSQLTELHFKTLFKFLYN